MFNNELILLNKPASTDRQCGAHMCMKGYKYQQKGNS